MYLYKCISTMSVLVYGLSSICRKFLRSHSICTVRCDIWYNMLPYRMMYITIQFNSIKSIDNLTSVLYSFIQSFIFNTNKSNKQQQQQQLHPYILRIIELSTTLHRIIDNYRHHTYTYTYIYTHLHHHINIVVSCIYNYE